MDIRIFDDPSGVAAGAADIVQGVIGSIARPVLGFATGSSPLPLYEELATRRALRDIDGVRGFALDEYVGLPYDDSQSYHQVVARTIEAPLGLRPGSIRVPDGMATDLDEACRSFEREIAEAGGIDVQVLGIGSNGHIGFNEPSSSLAARTHVVALAGSTREDNARYFGNGGVPTLAVTQGLGTILDSRLALLVATGSRKAAAVARALEGPVSSSCPASVLQLHDRVVVCLDEAAASELTNREYYSAAQRAFSAVR